MARSSLFSQVEGFGMRDHAKDYTKTSLDQNCIVSSKFIEDWSRSSLFPQVERSEIRNNSHDYTNKV
jgi:hypothetical protein